MDPKGPKSKDPFVIPKGNGPEGPENRKIRHWNGRVVEMAESWGMKWHPSRIYFSLRGWGGWGGVQPDSGGLGVGWGGWV